MVLNIERDTVEWDISGFTDENGNLGRMAGPGLLRVPGKIELTSSNDALTWRVLTHQYVHPTSKLLGEFVQLWEKGPLEYLAFARRWGVLYQDASGRPCQTYLDNPTGVEALETWRYYSQKAYAVLRLAAALNRGKLGDLEHWRSLCGFGSKSGTFLAELTQYCPTLARYIKLEYPFNETDAPEGAYIRDIEEERRYLGYELNGWLKLGRVGNVTHFVRNKWHMEMDFGGCFLSAIAFQLQQTVSRAGPIFTCSGCGFPYARLKAPRSTSQNFCNGCRGKGVPLQRADERRREKMRKVKQLHSKGYSAADIARKVETMEATILRWLKKETDE